MKNKQDYIDDLAEIRSVMERSSKFLSLSGLAGIMAGIYALAGAFVARQVFQFNPDQIIYNSYAGLSEIIILAVLVLILAMGTAVFLSCRKANKRGEKAWNTVSRRLVMYMAVPLAAGGILILILIAKGLIGLIVPFTLLFYGLALFNGGKFTYDDIQKLGLIEIGLGLICTWFIEYSMIFWAVGFGVFHIGYGIYMYLKYER